jgi:RNA-binding protein YhbY
MFICSNKMYSNSYQFFFLCDQYGIVSVEKHTSKTIKSWWKRDEDHHNFLKMKAKKDVIKQECKDISVWVNKVGEIIRNFDNFLSTNKAVSVMLTENEEERKKKVASLISVRKKCEALQNMAMCKHEEMENLHLQLRQIEKVYMGVNL